MCKHPLTRVPLYPKKMKDVCRKENIHDTQGIHKVKPNIDSSRSLASCRRSRLTKTLGQQNNGNRTEEEFLAHRNRRFSEGSAKVMGQQVTFGSSKENSPPSILNAIISCVPSAQPIAYAGAKFSDPPSPKVLPKPPVHWVSNENHGSNGNNNDLTNILRVMLKVQT